MAGFQVAAEVLERYCRFLDGVHLVGHVVAEARGKTEDYLLREAYREVYKMRNELLVAHCDPTDARFSGP